jgi:5-enolpyruvylshikimate-3-phosphate synthase
MMATRVPDIEIEEPHVVEKSFPTFWDALTESGVTLDS